MANETDAKPPAALAKKARTRSPAYPYLDLRSALDKAAVIWRTEGRHAVAVTLAMQHWGYKADSSTGYSCIAALKKFGLVDEEGTGETRQVRLSRLALAVLLDDDRASPERNSALRTAALSPRIHVELWEKYGADLPSDSTLRRFLILEKNFNEAAVDEFLEEYKSTVAFAGLRDTESPSQTPVPPSVPAAATPRGTLTSRGTGSSEPPAAPVAQPGRAEGRPTSNRADTRRNPNPAPPPPSPPSAGLGRAKAVPAKTPAPEPETGFLFPEVKERDLPGAVPAASGDRRQQRAGVPASPRHAGGEDPAGLDSAAAPRELAVPLDNQSVVRVPYPMTEEDFDLLIETLHLWKRRLVRPQD